MNDFSALMWLGAEEEILAKLRNALESGNTEVLANSLNASIWFPALKDVRQMPGFKLLLRDAGLVDLWHERGWPDLCRPLGADDFDCD